MHLTLFTFQDSLKIEDMTKECENSTNLIPKLEENIPKLQKLLFDEEKVLEEMKENSKGNMTSLDSYYLKFLFGCVNKVDILPSYELSYLI